MTAEVKTFITSHSGSILSRNGYGLYTNPFRGFGSGRVRFQFNGALPVGASGAYIAGRR